MSRPKLILVAGGTASGKSTAVGRAGPRHKALVIEHDRYYLDVPDPRSHNFDHPDALDTALLVENLRELLAGRPAALPVYDFPSHRRRPERNRVQPRPIIIVEGILTLADPTLAALADLKIYVRAPADLRLARRVRRDAVERGRQIDWVLSRYLATVRPMHERYIKPTQDIADVVLDGELPMEDLAEAMVTAIGALQTEP